MDKLSHSTVLFADVAGSTALYQRVGDAEALARIGACLACISGMARGTGGRVIKSIGDELMCAFPDASSALRAATGMQQSQSEGRSGLPLRIGLHAGEAIERDGDLFGDTVNVAARVVELSKPGQILATLAAVNALPEFMRTGMRPLGRLSVRGRQQAVELFEVLWQWNGELTMVDSGQACGRTQDAAPASLALTYRGRRFDIGLGRAQLTLGRGEDSDIVVAARQASRLHGRIERQQSQFVFVDLSTNGSYVRIDGADELVLRREALPLRGTGTIGLGHSASTGTADLVAFRCC
jgi:adenylate cyclase